jgi:hypothetical protein
MFRLGATASGGKMNPSVHLSWTKITLVESLSRSWTQKVWNRFGWRTLRLGGGSFGWGPPWLREVICTPSSITYPQRLSILSSESLRVSVAPSLSCCRLVNGRTWQRWLQQVISFLYIVRLVGRHLVSPPCKNLGSLAACCRCLWIGPHSRLPVFVPTSRMLVYSGAVCRIVNILFITSYDESVWVERDGGAEVVGSCATEWGAVKTRLQQVECELSPSWKCCVAMRQ